MPFSASWQMSKILVQKEWKDFIPQMVSPCSETALTLAIMTYWPLSPLTVTDFHTVITELSILRLYVLKS